MKRFKTILTWTGLMLSLGSWAGAQSQQLTHPEVIPDPVQLADLAREGPNVVLSIRTNMPVYWEEIVNMGSQFGSRQLVGGAYFSYYSAHGHSVADRHPPESAQEACSIVMKPGANNTYLPAFYRIRMRSLAQRCEDHAWGPNCELTIFADDPLVAAISCRRNEVAGIGENWTVGDVRQIIGWNNLLALRIAR